MDGPPYLAAGMVTIMGLSPTGTLSHAAYVHAHPRDAEWNFSSCLALANMKKLEPVPTDLMLGSVILALLLVVIINGIVWNIV
jgi:hypothetical protein